MSDFVIGLLMAGPYLLVAFVLIKNESDIAKIIKKQDKTTKMYIDALEQALAFQRLFMRTKQ